MRTKQAKISTAVFHSFYPLCPTVVQQVLDQALFFCICVYLHLESSTMKIVYGLYSIHYRLGVLRGVQECCFVILYSRLYYR